MRRRRRIHGLVLGAILGASSGSTPPPPAPPPSYASQDVALDTATSILPDTYGDGRTYALNGASDPLPDGLTLQPDGEIDGALTWTGLQAIVASTILVDATGPDGTTTSPAFTLTPVGVSLGPIVMLLPCDGDLVDVSGNANNGTALTRGGGAAAFVAGPDGRQALSLAAGPSSPYVQIADAAGLRGTSGTWAMRITSTVSLLQAPFMAKHTDGSGLQTGGNGITLYHPSSGVGTQSYVLKNDNAGGQQGFFYGVVGTGSQLTMIGGWTSGATLSAGLNGARAEIAIGAFAFTTNPLFLGFASDPFFFNGPGMVLQDVVVAAEHWTLAQYRTYEWLRRAGIPTRTWCGL